MKKCPCCNIEKIESEFANDKHTKSGKTVYCIPCLDIKSKKYMATSRGRMKAKLRSRRERFINPDGTRTKYKLLKRNYNKTANGKYYNIQGCAKRRGIDFSMLKDEFVAFFEQNKTHCHYCLRPMLFGQGVTGNYMDALSIDRKDSSQGYHIDNIVCACRRCNTIKGNWFTHEQMVEIAKNYLQQEVACA